MSLETNGHPQDFVSEPHSEESKIDVGPEVVDIITDIDSCLDFTDTEDSKVEEEDEEDYLINDKENIIPGIENFLERGNDIILK